MIAVKHPPCGGGGEPVDGAVLSGTLTPGFSGTRIPYYPERKCHVTFGYTKRNPPLLTLLTEESFGFLLTHPITGMSPARGKRP